MARCHWRSKVTISLQHLSCITTGVLAMDSLLHVRHGEHDLGLLDKVSFVSHTFRFLSCTSLSRCISLTQPRIGMTMLMCIRTVFQWLPFPCRFPSRYPPGYFCPTHAITRPGPLFFRRSKKFSRSEFHALAARFLKCTLVSPEVELIDGSEASPLSV
jgi:hypothetical protein